MNHRGRTPCVPTDRQLAGFGPATSMFLSAAFFTNIIIREHAQRGTLDVAILAAAQGPQEGGQTGQAQPQRHRHEINQHVHGRSLARNALSVTEIDEPDIASAAINGVTAAKIAIGTATAL